MLTIDVHPDVERHALVHHGQEWIHCNSLLTFLLARLEDLLCHNLFKLFKCLKLYFKENLLLCAAWCVSSLHGLVKELVEIDKAILIAKHKVLDLQNIEKHLI